MGFVSHRAYGGLGFTLNRPETAVRLEKSNDRRLIGFERLGDDATEDVNRLLQRFTPALGDNGFQITLESCPPQHVGFGSKTSLLLTITAGLAELFRLEISRPEMQRLTGRGSGSGIGLHAFFAGGWVSDGGHPASEVKTLVPSSAITRKSIPPLIARVNFLANWRIALLLPKEFGASGANERDFFASSAPVPPNEALETIALLYHGVLPAAVLGEVMSLGRAIRGLQTIGFKAREIAARTDSTRQLLNELHARDLAAGMSSMGPLIYAIVHADDHAAIGTLEALCRSSGADWLGLAEGYNSGYTVERIST
jgi:beta-ribofuranosylaminobenzene 5'-phosphate synthase